MQIPKGETKHGAANYRVWLESQGRTGNEGWRGKGRSTGGGGGDQRLFHEPGPPPSTTRRGGPADGAVLTQKRPVFSLSIISPPATQLRHFFSRPPATSSTHRNVQSMTGTAGSRDAPPLLGSICRHTPPESNQTRGVARTARFCS